MEFEVKQDITMRGIPSGIGNAGIGHVIIPEGIDPNIYKANCYKRNEVSIWGGMGYGNFHNVSIDEDSIQRIQFPEKVGENGTAVVWVNIPKFNQPLIIATLRFKDDHYPLDENIKRVTVGNGGNGVDVKLDGNSSKIAVNLTADENNESEVHLNLKSLNKGCKLKIFVEGDTEIHSLDNIRLTAEKSFEVIVPNIENEKETRIKYESGKGFSYKDEFDNQIDADKDGVYMQTPKNLISIENSGKIMIESESDDVTIRTTKNEVSLSGTGVNIDAGSGSVTINGQNNVLYSKITGATEILDVKEIGVSQKVKVGK